MFKLCFQREVAKGGICGSLKHRAPRKSVSETKSRTFKGRNCSMKQVTPRHLLALVLAPGLATALPGVAAAATVSNPLCPSETAFFNPGHGEDIVVPKGFTVSVFATGLNFPTGI